MRAACKGWRTAHRRGKECMNIYKGMQQLTRDRKNQTILANWHDLYRTNVNERKALLFKYFKLLKKNRLREMAFFHSSRLEMLQYKIKSRLLNTCIAIFKKKLLRRKLHDQLRERCQLKQHNNLKVILLKIYQLYQAKKQSSLQ